MNWAQIRALNSTVGTDKFKPLDVILKEKVDALHGVYINTGHAQKKGSFNGGFTSFDVGFTPQKNKLYAVEYQADIRYNGENYHTRLRSETFMLRDDVNVYDHARQDIISFDFDGAELTLMSSFSYDANTNHMWVLAFPASRAGACFTAATGTFKILNIYEVI